MTTLILHFIYAAFPTLGFCILFKVPVKKFPACIIIGAMSWTCYQLLLYCDAAPVAACFAASCLVGFLSDRASRLLKEAATVFIIPGILCLVPGAKIFYTMEALLRNDVQDMAQIGVQTLMMAGAIALGLLVIGAVVNVFWSIVHKTASIKDSFK